MSKQTLGRIARAAFIISIGMLLAVVLIVDVDLPARLGMLGALTLLVAYIAALAMIGKDDF